MIEKKPFTKYTLDEDKIITDVETISMKVNLEERALIERLKRMTNYDQDAKVIKIGLAVLEKVILNNFGSDVFGKLTSLDRVKPIFEKDKDKLDFEKK